MAVGYMQKIYFVFSALIFLTQSINTSLVVVKSFDSFFDLIKGTSAPYFFAID